jgi:predicted GIY-YIG superfamily endonuclease
VELVWSDEVERIDDAYAAEKKIQGWSRAKREALIAGGYEAVRRLMGHGDPDSPTARG